MAKLIPKFYSHKEPGKKMKIENLKVFNAYIESLTGRLEIIISEYKEKRSSPQNRYYYGVIVEVLRKHIGYTAKEMHSSIGLEFLLVEEEGKPSYIKSTADLDTKEFVEFNEDVKIWAAIEFGVNIPDPEKVDIR